MRAGTAAQARPDAHPREEHDHGRQRGEPARLPVPARSPRLALGRRRAGGLAGLARAGDAVFTPVGGEGPAGLARTGPASGGRTVPGLAVARLAVPGLAVPGLAVPGLAVTGLIHAGLAAPGLGRRADAAAAGATGSAAGPAGCARLATLPQENWSGGVPAWLPGGGPVCGPAVVAP